jgi:hypothetical protein
VFVNPSAKQYQGIAKVKEVSPVRKFTFDVSLEWLELSALSFTQTAKTILFDSNQLLNNAKNFSPIPWNVGVDLCQNCIKEVEQNTEVDSLKQRRKKEKMSKVANGMKEAKVQKEPEKGESKKEHAEKRESES